MGLCEDTIMHYYSADINETMVIKPYSPGSSKESENEPEKFVVSASTSIEMRDSFTDDKFTPPCTLAGAKSKI